MKKILVIYFTQTGQARKAIDAVLKPFLESGEYQVSYELIKPLKEFAYPWKYNEFMDAFPENVQEVACPIQPLKTSPDEHFDLIIISYQPWFLSVCRPIMSFLQSNEADLLLKDKKVITIINCRNMWMGAQEKMKRKLKKLQANLVGNIVFPDHHANLTNLITVLAFELKGVKEKFMGIFPKYGVDDKDLEKGHIAGEHIKNALEKSDFGKLQEQFVHLGLVEVKANLIIMEGRGQALFPLYAKYITKKGGEGSEARKTRVKIFGILLPTVIFIFSPIITIIARLTPFLAASKIKKQMAYYQQNSLENCG